MLTIEHFITKVYVIFDHPSYVAKTKALISFAVTAKLICVFVFAYAKGRVSHDEVHIQGSKTQGIQGYALFFLMFAQNID